VNKADGALAAAASQAATDYAHALTLLQSPVEGWQVPVLGRAVSSAKRRNPAEQYPMPHLQQLHADGLVKHRNNKAAALPLYVNSAKGYMQANDYYRTDKVLKHSWKLNKAVTTPKTGELKELQSVLDFQVKLREDGKLLYKEPETLKTWITANQPEALKNPKFLSTDFVTQQRMLTGIHVGNQFLKAGKTIEAGQWGNLKTWPLKTKKPDIPLRPLKPTVQTKPLKIDPSRFRIEQSPPLPNAIQLELKNFNRNLRTREK
ncbi:MAG: hypothetical protein AAF492_23590, partial [Verrucomicrobiota bacterium]